MSGYTIASESELSAERLKAAYQEAKTDTNSFSYAQLDIIFEIALQSRELFPRLSGVKSPENYIKHWVNEYRSAIQTPPHARQAKAKSACADPALKKIVMETLGVSESVADEKQAAHNLFMSAENVQGGLLEEYIAVSTKPYGWIWCAGQTLHAVDFCSSDEAVLLQVKNKYNSENSSSKNIREGTTIVHWYRLGFKTVKGIMYPNYQWEKLNAIINAHRTGAANMSLCQMSEDRYLQFISTHARANRQLISAQ